MLETTLSSQKLSLLHERVRDFKDYTKMLRRKDSPIPLWLLVQREALRTKS